MSPRCEPLVVSCIIAVFDGEAYLHEAIESLLGQTFRRSRLSWSTMDRLMVPPM